MKNKPAVNFYRVMGTCPKEGCTLTGDQHNFDTLQFAVRGGTGFKIGKLNEQVFKYVLSLNLTPADKEVNRVWSIPMVPLGNSNHFQVTLETGEVYLVSEHDLSQEVAYHKYLQGKQLLKHLETAGNVLFA